MLQGKKIILGITGGIAAYKTAFLVRLLKKNGADVHCIMTPASFDFISPLTLSTLSGNPVYSEFWNKKNGEWVNHVALGLWADLMIIAPLTANTLAKMANGNCDNLLTATYLSARCPVMIAPAMDLDMYAHPSTTDNLSKLKDFGTHIIPAEHGFLASGLEGQGRMAEPETIFEEVELFFKNQDSLKGQKILITAGPTYEALDPVRFLGNHSSGKMGFELAENMLNRGGEVVLVSGPTQLHLKHKKLKRIDVESAEEMFEVVKLHFPSVDGGIFAAAVSDYRPKNKATQKIKKNNDSMTLELVKNPDILKWAGNNKKNNQWLCGFALETNDAINYGKGKLENKNLDFIVINSLEDKGAGFGVKTNKITILDKHSNQVNFDLTSKKVAADNILNYIIKQK